MQCRPLAAAGEPRSSFNWGEPVAQRGLSTVMPGRHVPAPIGREVLRASTASDYVRRDRAPGPKWKSALRRSLPAPVLSVPHLCYRVTNTVLPVDWRANRRTAGGAESGGPRERDQ